MINKALTEDLSKTSTTNPNPDIDIPLLPPKIFEVNSRRLEQLSEKTRELMWLAAAIRREFSFEILKHSSEWDEF